MGLVVNDEKHEETHREHDNATNNVRDQFRKLIYNFLWLLWIIWKAKKEGCRSQRIVQIDTFARAELVIYESLSLKALKIGEHALNRYLRTVHAIIVSSFHRESSGGRLCSTTKLEQPPRCVSTSCENQELIKYHGSARFTNF